MPPFYVIGHKNPDTDAICSAIGYAALLQQSGMQADAVDKRRIQTLEDLELYGYQVAGTVGLMLLPLLKARPEAKEPAVALGTAIQLINILRDATPDAIRQRICSLGFDYEEICSSGACGRRHRRFHTLGHGPAGRKAPKNAS